MRSVVKRLGAALLAPWALSVATGHLRSSLADRPMDRHGHPLPWYTYPAIDFLGAQDFRHRRVLEFGCGQSTLWWAARAASVVALDDDPAWVTDVTRRAPANVTVRLVPTVLEHCDERADVVVIDGLDRYRGAELAPEMLTPDGAIVFDNAEGFWGERIGAPAGTYPIPDLLRRQGFGRVDFVGFTPAGRKRHVTSVFFRWGCFLFAGPHPPAVPHYC